MGMQFLLGIIGLSSGFIVAGGVIALSVGLGIFTRYTGITHTAKRIRLYETAILFGGIMGNIMTVYDVSIPLGGIGLAVMGTFFGVFVGSWILALAEIVNIFPVFFRRMGVTKGLSLVIIAIAVGKTLGSLVHFYMRW